MKKFRTLWIIALALLVSSCAGSTQKTQTAANLSSPELTAAEQFVPDPSPMTELSHWIEKANQEDPSAMFVLHMMYRDNLGGVDSIFEGHPANKKLDAKEMHQEMITWRDLADDQYFIYAQLAKRPSLVYETEENTTYGEEYTQAREFLEEAAKRGHANAEYVLGLILWNGLGVNTDKNRAFDLFMRSAVHGLPNAMYHVGMIYEMGLNDNSPDPKLAHYWLEKAMNAGNMDAVFINGMSYMDGIHVQKNTKKAEDIFRSDLVHHEWTQLYRDHLGDFRMICTSSYDESTIKDRYSDDCDGEYFDEDPELANMTYDEQETYIRRQGNQMTAEKSLDYKIDYLLARNWLEIAASDLNHDHSRVLLAQIYVSDGCDGGKNVNEITTIEESAEILKSAAEHHYPHIKLYQAALYQNGMEFINNLWDDDEDSETIQETREKWAKIAMDFYESAAKDNDKKAYTELGKIYAQMDYPSLSNVLNTPQDFVKAYNYYMKAEDKFGAFDTARDQVDNLVRQLDENKKDNTKELSEIMDWCQKAMAQSEPLKDDVLSIGTIQLVMAHIYDEGGEKFHDMNKAMDLYHQALSDNKYTFYDNEQIVKVALRLAEIYQKGINGVQSDQRLAIEWYRRAIESDFERKHTNQAVSFLKKLNYAAIENAVEEQIKLEKNKNPNGFFVIKSGLYPCQDEPDQCASILKDIYAESIKKAMIAFTAFSLVKQGKADLDYIRNSFYMFYIVYGRDQNYLNKLVDYSAVYAAIDKDNYVYHADSLKLFYIWYLRQIPYAAADEFKKLNITDKSWEDYVKEATEIVNNSDLLKSGFEYILDRQQPFPKGLNE